MKILTVTTSPYLELTLMLKKSLQGYGHHLMVQNYPLHENVADFGSSAFNLICKKKAESIVEFMRQIPHGEILLYADSDVVFTKDPIWFEKAFELAEDIDMVAQSDVGTVCAGLFAVRVSPETIAFWEEIARETSEHENDQIVLNRKLQNNELKVALVSESIAFNYGAVSKGSLWNGQVFDFPKEMVAFHANYTIGFENKKKLLNLALKYGK